VDLTVAIGLIVVALAVTMIRQHAEAAQNVPFVAGPFGVIIPFICAAGAIYIMAIPIVKQRGLPSPSDLLGYSASATQTATTLLAMATPTPAPTPTLAPTPEFQPYWVQNTRQTQMWSGPAGQQGVVSFGVTSAISCYFEVSGPLARSRLYVKNPYDMNYFWIDAEAVTQAPGPPEHRPGPKPKDQNCVDAIFDG
jgi:hypothetical protein